MEKKQKLFLGLDIGTNSVGWCVTDEHFNIIKKRTKRGNNTCTKHLWGVRLFDEAKSAATRRQNRSNRRRLQRRRQRILYLQDEFRDEMSRVDPFFFDRLNNASLWKEDRPEFFKNGNLLFQDTPYGDHDFYQKYPTIYHLRKALIQETDMKFDIRLIYLALAHMVKYRGNFLMEGDREATEPTIGSIRTALNEFNEWEEGFKNIEEDSDDEEPELPPFDFDDDKLNKLMKLFKQTSGKGDLLDEEVKILFYPKKRPNDIRINFLKLINGSNVALSSLYPKLSEEAEEASKEKADFTTDFAEKKMLELPALIGDQKAGIFPIAKKLFDFRCQVNLKKDSKYISEAMVSVYEKHSRDLKNLKHLIKTYYPREYSAFFRKVKQTESKDNGKVTSKPSENYATYVGFNKINNKTMRVAHCNQEDFYKKVKAILDFEKVEQPSFVWKNPKDKQIFEQIKKDLEDKTFMPRQNSKENGIFPYQENKMEMKAIIDNQKKFYPFLGEMAPDFISPEKKSYRIISILEYKIPYYVGPLSSRAKQRWMVRKSEGKITPWNFNDLVDKEQTQEKFIESLKNDCTYLIGEPTLPEDSLMYEEFVLLNEMNNWLINDMPISIEDKEYLIKNAYLENGKPGIEKLKKVLKTKYGFPVSIKSKGKQTELHPDDLHATLKSWIAMSDERGFGTELFKSDELKKKAEKIIFLNTIFDNNKDAIPILKRMGLKEDQIRYFCSLKFAKWGKLSAKLLDGLKSDYTNPETGEVLSVSILDLMRHQPWNFMEIYETKATDASYRFSFHQKVDKLNDEETSTVKEFIEEEYVSPSMKRSLRQTMRVVEELKRILHIDSFDSYFVETNRESNPELKGKRTSSRKKQLDEYYQLAKSINKEAVSQNMLERLEKTSDDELRSKRLFRYFLQLGKSVYTGEEIDLDKLDSDYDIDHIIPKAKLKDDSLVNTVLVEKAVNNYKGDFYPIPRRCLTEKGKEWVKFLNRIRPKRNNAESLLMPDEKMERILRSVDKPLTEEEIAGFVNRQLTMTNQAAKAVCDVLKKTDPKAEVVYSKSGIVSDFRQYFDIPKSRDINDFHHAHDAYLNVVVGNVYNHVFSSHFDAELVRRKKAYFESLKLDVENFFGKNDQHMLVTDTLVWKAKKKDGKGTIDTVRKNLAYQDPLVTQMLFTRIGDEGFFGKIGLHTAAEGSAEMPLKDKAPFNLPGFEKKYGGYNDLTAPYFMLIQSEDATASKKAKKTVHIYSLENIPAVYASRIHSDEDRVNYLNEHADKYKLLNPKVILARLPIRSVIEFHGDIDGKDYYTRVGISGKSEDRVGGVNLFEAPCSSVMYRRIRWFCKKDNKGNFMNKVTEKNSQELSELFQSFVQFIDDHPNYRLIPGRSTTLMKMKNCLSSFNECKADEKRAIIDQLVVLLSCKSGEANLKAIGLSEKSGALKFSKKLPPKTRIVGQSVTGFYETILFTIPED